MDDQLVRKVAERCFGFGPRAASLVEDVAGELLSARAASDWLIYKEVMDGAGKCPFGRRVVKTVPVALPYDEPLMDVLEGEMRVSEVRVAFEAKYPDVRLPLNLSMAMLRLKDRGVATNRINAHRVSFWRRIDQ